VTPRDRTTPSAAGSFIIRAAGPRDVDAIALLLTASAEAQGWRDSLCVNAETLLRDGFVNSPRFHLRVADANTAIVGFALYFFTYSTWTSVNGRTWKTSMWISAGVVMGSLAR
jgi:hypothetical protein